MNAVIEESEISGIRWLVVSGERLDAFTLLGQYAKESITTVQNGLPEREALRQYTATGRGRRAYDSVVTATTELLPDQLAELQALAAGAEIDFDDLLIANLRGDIGVDDGTGCTDIGWRGARSFVAHNEDGAPALDGHFALLTLRIDGDIPVTVQWYPGFLPSNTLTASAAGVIWGINHLQVVDPIHAAGRHFVARGLQQSHTLDEAIGYLESNPSAGGFAYTIGELGSGRVAVVEAAAGRTAVMELGPTSPFSWHTNHIRFMPDPPDIAPDGAATGQLGLRDESLARGTVLKSLTAPSEPDVTWFYQTMAGSSVPTGVHRTAAGTDPLMTLCTTVTDLLNETIDVRGVHGSPTSLLYADFAQGTPVSGSPTDTAGAVQG
jgi:Acyl-coenzyme A:6-aminopenicillanic acid acyl-transferase